MMLNAMHNDDLSIHRQVIHNILHYAVLELQRIRKEDVLKTKTDYSLEGLKAADPERPVLGVLYRTFRC